MALIIDAAYELFGFLLRPWIGMAQQTIQRRPIVARVIFFAPLNSLARLPATIARRRFLTSAPVTPEIHGDRDSV